MKKMILLCALFVMGGALTVQAQTCCKKGKADAKSCHKSEAKASATTMDEATLAKAVMAAEKDESIEKKVCSHSGNVSFVRLAVNEETGEEVSTPVTFDAAEAKFVNMSKDAKSGCCKKDGAKKACSGKKAEASSEEPSGKTESKKT